MATNWLPIERVKEALPTAVGVNDKIIGNIAEAAVTTVENYCHRHFALDTYEELYYGSGKSYLLLNNMPIVSVQSVRTGQQPALYVQNTRPTGEVQASNLTVGTTGLTLTQISNAVTTSTELLYTDYPTLPELRDAINLLGNGWNAQVPPPFLTWASEDLRHFPGTFSVRNLMRNCYVFYWYLSDYRISNPPIGELYFSPGWTYGYNNYLITYTAGFACVPDDIIQATAELAKATYLSRRINPNLASETLDKYSYSVAAQQSLKNLSPLAQQALANYRLTPVARWSI